MEKNSLAIAVIGFLEMLNKNHWRSPIHLSVYRAASSMPSGNAAHASDFYIGFLKSPVIILLMFFIMPVLAANNNITINATSCTDSEGNCVLSMVQAQDGIAEPQAGHNSGNRFIETKNTNTSAITSPDLIANVTVYIDRFESANPGSPTITLSVTRPSDGVGISCTLAAKTSNDSVYDKCDATSLINGSSNKEADAENLTIRYNIQALGAGNTMFLDHVYVDIVYTDSTPPAVALNRPSDGNWSNSTAVVFEFTPNDTTSGISSCTLVLNGAANRTNSSITKGQLNTLTSPLLQGTHNWTVNCTDSSANSNIGTNNSIRTINVDIIQPNVQLNSPANNTNSSQAFQLFNFTHTDNIAANATCQLFANGSSVNSTTANNNTASVLGATLGEGRQPWHIECKDLALNSNISLSRNITIDFTKPLIANFTHTPSSADDLDPNFNVTVKANITDNFALDRLILQYRLKNDTQWNENNMTSDGGTGYIANFTPTDGNWSFRVFANDTAGNENTSSVTNITVENDVNLLNSTNILSVKAIVKTEDRIFFLGNITANNTGDFELNFTINSTQTWISFNGTYNNTINFTLAQKINMTLNVTANTTGFAVGEFPFNITIFAFRSGSIVFNNTILAKAIVQNVAGPYLTVTITSFDSNVTQGGTVNLSATVKNDGTGDATGTWLAWLLPSGWINSSGTLNKSIGFFGIGNTVNNDITVSVASDASTGTFNLTALSASAENATGNNTKLVIVNALPAAAASTPAPSGGGGGGAGGGVIIVLPPTIKAPDKIILEKGKEIAISVEVTNPNTLTDLENIELSLSGYSSALASILPEKIERIKSNKTTTFQISLRAPRYVEAKEYSLEIKVKATASVNKKLFVSTFNFILIIVSVDENETLESLQAGERSILKLSSSNFTTNKINKLLERAKSALEEGKYDEVKRIAEEIAAIEEKAMKAKSIILEIEAKLSEAESRGLDATETIKLYELAKAAFAREDYDRAIERANSALLTYNVETKGKVNYYKTLQAYWWAVLAGVFMSFYISFFLYRRISLMSIGNKLLALRREEPTIGDLIEKVQRQRFVEKSVSEADYRKSLYEYQKRLSEIRKERAKLLSRQISMLNFTSIVKGYTLQDERILGLMKDAQEKYFEKGTMSKSAYENAMKMLKTERAEVIKTMEIAKSKGEKQSKFNFIRQLFNFLIKAEEKAEFSLRGIIQMPIRAAKQVIIIGIRFFPSPKMIHPANRQIAKKEFGSYDADNGWNSKSHKKIKHGVFNYTYKFGPLLIIAAVFAIGIFNMPNITGFGANNATANYASTPISATEAIEKAGEEIKEMQQLGFGIQLANDTLAEAKLLLRQSNYSAAEEKAKYVFVIKQTAIETNMLIDEADVKLYEASLQFNISAAHEIFKSAIQAFEDENYIDAKTSLEATINKIDELKEERARELALERAKEFDIVKFAKNNWHYILTIILVLAIMGRVLYKRHELSMAVKKLHRLEHEEETIRKLLADNQRKYYEYGTMSKSQYTISKNRYQNRLLKIKKDIPVLKSQILELSGKK